jgi:hypothetical protein
MHPQAGRFPKILVSVPSTLLERRPDIARRRADDAEAKRADSVSPTVVQRERRRIASSWQAATGPAPGRGDAIAPSRLLSSGGVRRSHDQVDRLLSRVASLGVSAHSATHRWRSLRLLCICSSANPSAKKHSAASPGRVRVRPSRRSAAISEA